MSGSETEVEYLPRLIDEELASRMASFAAVMIVGPRACGKTTSAARVGTSLVRLDRPATANVFRADPDAALAGRDEPVVLDEWEDVAEVLGAVKRSVDADPRAGRFVLTGSVSGQLDASSWPGTGWLVQLEMFGPTVRERLGMLGARPWMGDLLRGQVRLPFDRPDLIGYVDLALSGGFPDLVGSPIWWVPRSG